MAEIQEIFLIIHVLQQYVSRVSTPIGLGNKHLKQFLPLES